MIRINIILICQLSQEVDTALIEDMAAAAPWDCPKLRALTNGLKRLRLPAARQAEMRDVHRSTAGERGTAPQHHQQGDCR